MKRVGVKERLARCRVARLFAAALLIPAALPSSVAALGTDSGDLAALLKAIDYGDKDANDWDLPEQATAAAFGAAIDALLMGNPASADALAAGIGYQVVLYTDTARKPNRTYHLLREVNPLPSPLFLGGGTYVINPAGLPLAIEAPHPVSDLFTETEAIEIFLRSNAKLLLLSGTHRENSTQPSQCTDGGYRVSDASHSLYPLLFEAHARASLFDPNLVFVQLHGFGSASLATLQSQCGTTDDRLVNLSEGVTYHADLSGQSFLAQLTRAINADGKIKACVYGNQTSSLGGTWTTTGRFTNQSPDPCAQNAASSSRRFVHLEQSYRVRSSYRPDMARYITDTANQYFNVKTTGGTRAK